MSHHGHGPAPKGLPDPTFEDRDIDLNALIKGVAICFASIFVSIVLMVWLEKALIGEHKSSSAVALERQLPPENLPRLQVLPVQDLNQYKADQQELLTTLEYTDDSKTTIRMPIEDAMKKALEKNLFPARKVDGH